VVKVIFMLSKVAAGAAKSWDLKEVEGKQLEKREEKRVEQIEIADLQPTADAAVSINLTAVYASLDHDAKWLDGDVSDSYWSARERAVIQDQEQVVKQGIATYGAYEYFADRNQVQSNGCCTTHWSAEHPPSSCGLYGGMCCFYSLRHICAAANNTAAVTKRYSGFTRGWGEVADQLQGRTMLFVGDSVSHQTFEAAVCDLHRHGFVAEEAVLSAGGSDHCVTEEEFSSKKVCCQRFVSASTSAGAKSAGSTVNPSGASATLCFMWMAEFNKTDLIRGLAHTDHPIHVLVINLGLWYGDSEQPGECALDLTADLKTAFSLGTAWAEKSSDRVVIFRGTTPQHFAGHGPQASGAYDHNQQAGTTPQCVPHDGYRGGGPGNAPLEADPSGHFAPDVCALRVLNSMGLNYGNSKHCSGKVYFVPVSKPFADRYDAHMGSGLAETREGRGADCSHYCFFPRLWEVLWGRLYLALQHHAAFCCSPAAVRENRQRGD
jgi:hypothetical protein